MTELRLLTLLMIVSASIGCAPQTQPASQAVSPALNAEVQRKLAVLCETTSWPEIVRRSADLIALCPPSNPVTGQLSQEQFVTEVLRFVSDNPPEPATSRSILWMLHQTPISNAAMARYLRPFLYSDGALKQAALLVARDYAASVEVRFTNRPDYMTNFLVPPLGVSPRAGTPDADPPPELTRYLFQVHPDAALREMLDVYSEASERDAVLRILRAEASISHYVALRLRGVPATGNAKNEADVALSQLASDDRWWARLYVCEVMCQNRVLYSPQLIERLKEDSNPLVRESAIRVESAQVSRAPQLEHRR